MIIRLALLALLLAGCPADTNRQLHVDLVTDLVPLIEFDGVRLELDDGTVISQDIFAVGDADYLRGVRLISMPLPLGTSRLTTTLRRNGRVIATRGFVIEAGTASRPLTVLVSRDCQGVMCPSGGNDSFETCEGGACVDPRCAPETPEHCSPECVTNDDCAGEFAECAEPRCIFGVCLGDADLSLCAMNEYCDGTLGCRASPLRVDAGVMDAGVMDAGLADAPEEMDGVVFCGQGEHVVSHMCISCSEGTGNLSGDATSGADTTCDDDVCALAFGVRCDDFSEAYIKASNTGSGDFFGRAVSLSGDSMAVGVSGEASAARGIGGDQTNDSATDSGAVYIFSREGTTWIQEAYIKASNTDAGDRFGFAVALDGDTLVVGADRESSAAQGVTSDGTGETDNSANVAGAAYVFVRTAGTWTQQAYIKASNAESGDLFGSAVAISGDTLAVGAYSEDSSARGIDGDQDSNGTSTSGAVYVFVRAGETWSQQAYIKASNSGVSNWFGFALALDDNTLAVGALGERSAATGVDGDGTDRSAVQSGAAYIFVRSGTVWNEEAYIKASNTETRDNFGSSIALSGDLLAVGARNEESGASGIDGDETDDSQAQSGAVYVFARVGTTWNQEAYIKASNNGLDHTFGLSIALDGQTLIAGARHERSAATHINGDEMDTSAFQSGAAYLFVRTAGIWRQQAYIKASNTETRDNFGVSVSISGHTIAVGAHAEDSRATGVGGDETDNSVMHSGAVYIRRIAP